MDSNLDGHNKSLEDAKELFSNYYKGFNLGYLDLIIDGYLLSCSCEIDDDYIEEYYREQEEYEELTTRWAREYEEERDLDGGESEISKYGGRHGLNDETIDEAFEGDPEWYWNTD